MKIALTGASGLVGRALGRRLTEQGHELTVLMRDPGKSGGLGFPARAMQWEAEKGTASHSILDECDVVIHLAGESIAGARWTKARKKQLIDSRVEGTRRISEASRLLDKPLRVFIQASAVGIYGDRGDEILTETSPAGSDFLAKLCLDWEQAGRAVQTERLVQLRFGLVLSREGGLLHQMESIFKKLGASRLGSGRQWMSWVHIADLVRMIELAIADQNLSGVYNAVSPSTVTNADMTKNVAKAIGAWSAPPVPEFALRLLYGEMADALLGSQRVLPEKLFKQDFHFQFADLQSALKEIYG